MLHYATLPRKGRVQFPSAAAGAGRSSAAGVDRCGAICYILQSPQGRPCSLKHSDSFFTRIPSGPGRDAMNHALVRGFDPTEPCRGRSGRRCVQFLDESLILAQNERWQRGLGMQVERDRPGSNTGA